jgi:nucleolar GTP-binding protein
MPTPPPPPRLFSRRLRREAPAKREAAASGSSSGAPRSSRVVPPVPSAAKATDLSRLPHETVPLETQVPTAKDFIDVVLSRTQRQTPTVVHRGYAITRIRQFYMRKVKFTQTSWNEKLSRILEDFPRVDDIHPFYSDLLNVLYDKDHYKLALGQLNTARNIIDKIAKDYVKLLKYGDSLYRCKQLKRAALGRMCTIMKKHAASLAYLEQVRQHMSRLPSIDPNTRTILVCGYPNVGKSSFMNKVTRADVEVQPYAFTTKSIYVGHTDYKYLRWQVLDTPGILDRPLEERNTIEMQSITAMAHLRAVVLYIVDASEQCGYTIKQQSDLFHSIKPLFANKPLVVAINKTDVRKLEDLKPEDASLIDAMRDAARGPASLRMEGDDEDDLPTMSTLNEEGVSFVKQVCCDKLLAARVEQKLASRRAGEVLNRLHVAQPKPRDAVARPAVIPHSVALNRLKKADGSLKIVTEKELQDLNGGAGVYSADLRKDYQLDDDSWKYDIMPEIFNGKNVADFIDPEIDERLAELEREEDELEAAFAEEKAQAEMEAEPDMDDEEKALLKEVRGRRKELVETHRRKKSAGNNAPTLPRTVSASHADPAKRATTKRMKESLEAMGVDPSRAIARARDRSVAREGRLRKRSRSAADADEAMDDDEEKPRKHSSKSRSVSVARRVDRADRSKSVGLRDDDERMRAQKMADKAQRKMNKRAKIGEADRTIITKMPKHLFSGKRGIGKTDRR